MCNPLVSVLIPVYNRRKIIDQTIECILKQTYSNIEVIIGDNCSTDGTFDYIKSKYNDKKNFIIFQNSCNLGPVKNWIECFKRARGEYIKVLWSDDAISFQFIEQAVKALEMNREAVFFYSSVLGFSDYEESELKKIIEISEHPYLYENKFVRVFKKTPNYRIGKSGIYDKKFFLDNLLKKEQKIPFSATCALFRKKMFSIQEKIPSRYKYEHNKTGAGTDLRMFLDAFDWGNYFFYLDKPLAFFREHDGSITSSGGELYKGYLTAEVAWIEERSPESKYFKYLNATIIHKDKEKIKDIFSPKKCKKIIEKYYDSPIDITKFSNYIWLLARVFVLIFFNQINRYVTLKRLFLCIRKLSFADLKGNEK